MTQKNSQSPGIRPMLKTALRFVGVTAMTLTSVSSLAQWNIDPIVKLGADYDDNAELAIRTDREIELSGYLLDASANFDYASARTAFNVLPRVLFRNYPDEEQFDSTDLFLTSRFNHDMQSSSLAFRLFFDEQTVRTAERADSDLSIEDADDVEADDSGRVGLRGTRSKWRFFPRWNYRFSEASSFTADLEYVDVRYEDVFLDLLDDYRDTRLNLTYDRVLSSRNSFLITATGRRFVLEDQQLDDTTGYGLQAGFNRSLSQTTQFGAMIGIEDTDVAIGEADPQIVGNLTLSRQLETIRLFAQYRRSVNATGSGRLSLRDQVSVNFIRALSERISAGVGIRAYQSRGLGQTIDVDDRNYAQLRAQFIWYLSAAFSIEADYRYTVLDRGTVSGDRANSNHVNLWFVYQPNSPDR